MSRRPGKEAESAGYDAWLRGRSAALNVSMTDLEYELAMMAGEREDDGSFSAGFLDKPERWKSELSSFFARDPRWFNWAVTEYLKGR